MSTAPSTTVLKAFSVLNLFRDRPRLGVAECARLAGLARPSAHRMLVSLTQAGALERTQSGQYQLALGMFEIGAQAPFRRALYDQAHLPMEDLATETGLPVHLAVRQGQEVLYLLKISRDADRAQTRAGGRAPLHATAIGKILLADAPLPVAREVMACGFERFTSYTVTSPGQLCRQLDKIQRTGFAYDLEEHRPGLVCLATAIHDRDGRGLAALSLSAEAERYRYRLDQLRQPLRRAAEVVERNLRGLPRSVVTRLPESADARHPRRLPRPA